MPSSWWTTHSRRRSSAGASRVFRNDPVLEEDEFHYYSGDGVTISLPDKSTGGEIGLQHTEAEALAERDPIRRVGDISYLRLQLS